MITTTHLECVKDVDDETSNAVCSKTPQKYAKFL